jgi:hypothetical protein
MKYFVPPIVIPIFLIVAVLAYTTYRHAYPAPDVSRAVSENSAPAK